MVKYRADSMWRGERSPPPLKMRSKNPVKSTPAEVRAPRSELIALRPTEEDGVFTVHYCAHGIATIDLRQPSEEARGLVDNAARCPQGPQAQQQKNTLSDE